ncbi:Ubiquinone biosynthesis O-methyltransferase, mitochondrial [Baekduia alba]|nr:Ubiquinone biosynthesis O-methyltransferase, mitochondrial [Baekduia alba]
MTSRLLSERTHRGCPVCGSTDQSHVFATESLDFAALGDHAFASRKRPERMRLHLVECPVCDLVYASSVPSPEALASLYEAAAFGSAEEAGFAARTYGEAVAPLAARLPDRVGALDIGTGEGAFLAELLHLGFTEVAGIEPSTDPIAAAPDAIRPLIEQGVFQAGLHPVGSLSLITCFQTIEHVPDPAAMVRDAYDMLKPGGMVVIVCHDRRSRVNRTLGLRSPIMDVEHMQLFSPKSITELLKRGGLADVGRDVIRNRYPARYWAQLLPLPGKLHGAFEGALTKSGLGARPVSLNVGNQLAWGVKPA